MNATRKLWALFAVAMAILIVPTLASASVWTSNISYDGVEDVVQDNSVATALVENGDGIVSAGDIVVGFIKWNLNQSDGNPIEDHAIAVFAAEILLDNGAGPSSTGVNPTIHFDVGSTAASIAILSGLTGVVGLPLGSISVVMSANGGIDPTTQALAAGSANIIANYSPDLVVGISAVTDYFEAELRDRRTIPAGGGNGAAGADGLISVTDADGDGYADEYDGLAGVGSSISASTVNGFESGAFSVLLDFTGPGSSAYLPVSGVDLFGGPTTGQFILSDSTTLLQPDATQAANGYAFADQSIVRLNATPEPVSALVWVGLLGLGALQLRRQRG